MSESIRIEWGVNTSSGHEDINLEDMDIHSMEEWEALSQDEQREKLQEALDDFPSRVHAMVIW